MHKTGQVHKTQKFPCIPNNPKAIQYEIFFSHHGDKRIRHWLIQQMTNVLTP